MTRKSIIRRLLLYEAIGFMILIAVSWLNELVDLPSRLFGGLPGHNWHEAALETVVILAAGIPTFLLSRRLTQRLVYLEGFLRVCAWCRKLGVQEEWVSMEDYFERELRTNTSHGICPDCAARFRQEAAHAAKDHPARLAPTPAVRTRTPAADEFPGTAARPVASQVSTQIRPGTMS